MTCFPPLGTYTHGWKPGQCGIVRMCSLHGSFIERNTRSQLVWGLDKYFDWSTMNTSDMACQIRCWFVFDSPFLTGKFMFQGQVITNLVGLLFPCYSKPFIRVSKQQSMPCVAFSFTLQINLLHITGWRRSVPSRMNPLFKNVKHLQLALSAIPSECSPIIQTKHPTSELYRLISHSACVPTVSSSNQRTLYSSTFHIPWPGDSMHPPE